MIPDLPTCHCVLCEPPDQASARQQSHAEILRQVRGHGWVTLGILPGRSTPGWAFSVGLWHSYRSPEVAVFGMLLPTMRRWIHRVGLQVRDGLPVVPDVERDGVLDNAPMVTRAVLPDWYANLFGPLIGFYQAAPPSVCQLVWPDSHGQFPWQPGCGERCMVAQPRLWLRPEEHPDGSWRRIR